jgi:hypothetical protein
MFPFSEKCAMGFARAHISGSLPPTTSGLRIVGLHKSLLRGERKQSQPYLSDKFFDGQTGDFSVVIFSSGKI